MTSLSSRCYELLMKVPKGRVTTYKELGRALGTTGYRAIGQIMSRNPNAPQVPCHRVVQSNGAIGGYAFGPDKKIRLLKQEGVSVTDSQVDLEKFLYRFDEA